MHRRDGRGEPGTAGPPGRRVTGATRRGGSPFSRVVARRRRRGTDRRSTAGRPRRRGRPIDDDPRRTEPGHRRGARMPSRAVVPGSAGAGRLAGRLLVDQRRRRGVHATKSTIPSSAFSDHTGITATTVSIGNVSTLVAGLFKGAAVGARPTPTTSTPSGASTGARSWWTAATTATPVAPNKQQTQADVQKDFAMVGGLLPRGQLRRRGPEGQSPGAQRHRLARPGHQQPAQLASARPRRPTAGSSGP